MIHVDNALWLLMEKDPTLNPWAGEIRMHLDRFNDTRWHLAGNGSLSDFANGHRYFGFHRTETGWVFREWLPGAGGYKIVLSTDDWPFGGQSRTNMEKVYHTTETGFGYGIRLYLPCRCGVALKKVEW